MENVESSSFFRLAAKLIDQMYFEEDTLAWNKQLGKGRR
jgi:hypothetical protein